MPVSIILLGCVAVMTYYTVQFSREIDARLQTGFFDHSVGIFTAPFKVTVGNRLPLDELTRYLDGAGYQRSDPRSASNETRAYTVSGNVIEIHPDAETTRELGVTPVRAEIGKDERITALMSVLGGQRLKSALIEGEPLANLRDGDRRKQIAVAFADIPASLRDAVVAIEDRRFFTHHGVDYRGIGRALWADIHQGGMVQGGSTLTQQLIKNAFLTSDRTLARKLKEAMMALILESRLSKEEIFTLYCNNVYLGQSSTFAVHGFAQAAKVYFDKNLNELTLSESALLAGLIHAPNRYAATSNLQLAAERRNSVLDAMAETGAITTAQAEGAKREPLQLKKQEPREDYGASYFIDYVERFLDQRYGTRGESGARRVVTTMDPRLQRDAHEAIVKQAEQLDRVIRRPVRKGEEAKHVQAALVALDAHTGEVLAMVGGRSYDESQLNRATDARRQPGSTFKPFVYAAALSNRFYTPASLLSDRPQTFTYDGGRAEYTPANYHGGFTNRDVTLREALARSMNVPAVALAMNVGLGNVKETASSCGLDVPHVYPSLALGTNEATPLEMAAAYVAFANGGTALRPVPVKSIRGAEREANIAATSDRAFSPQVAYLLTSMMQSVVAEGTAARLRGYGLTAAVAGKTGTSNDGWFVGYTPNLVCAVWVGYDDNTDLGMKASETALPLWADFVKEALLIRPELGGDSFTRPSGIVEAEIDPTTGLLATAECAERRTELFIAGTEPFSECTHQSLVADASTELLSPDSMNEDEQAMSVTLEVCADSGMLASSACPHTLRRSFAIGAEPDEICNMEHERHVRRAEIDEASTSPADGRPPLTIDPELRSRVRRHARQLPPAQRPLWPPN
ncbi:MAG TPA: PBP1A family penicillin-binding protein [Blastocatellia bacterium]|nr:PBP1A family penicillin-binding protein [Blastocatellia bacterium]